ncbi:MAG: Zn-dependent hydrolase [Gemmatimonadota bacterium]|nr:Zn-dependent hydrolase [Gemmatimonadota bacterium]
MNRREFSSALIGGLFISGMPRTRWLRVASPGPRVDGERLNRQLAQLARFGANPEGGVTRPAYSEADRQAREYVIGLMREARLAPRIDVAGNIIATRAGRDASLKPLVFGSHVDSVPEGGSYDGNVGSLAAVEVARTLADRSIVVRHPIQVVVWQNEEGGLYGSRAVSGQLAQGELATVSRSGRTIADGISFLGGDPARISEARRAKGDIACYLELHIEQGGTLEREKLDIGIVEGIVGIKQWEVTVSGFANHAGTTPMDRRQDALLAAAKFVQAVNRIVTSVPGRQVGTVGRIQAFPGAPNVIPGRVVCTLELRDLDGAKIDILYERIVAEARAIGGENGTTFEYKPIHENIPAPSDPRVRASIADAAKELGLTTRVMPSGAGHDAQAMAQLGPMGMIFIPSVGGISHSPKEFSRPADIVNGANVLLATILRMDQASFT